MSDVTRILEQIDAGDPAAASELFPLVYDELRRLAAILLAGEKPGQTLQPTALVNEVWLRLVGGPGSRCHESEIGRHEAGASTEVSTSSPQTPAPSPQPLASSPPSSRARFFAAAAEAMRRILVDNARRRATQKRGGGLARQELLDSDIAAVAPPSEVIGVHEALDALAAKDSLTAELIKLRYFAGFSLEEAGGLLGMSRATAYRLWTYGRAWLRAELTDAKLGSAPRLP